jgi:hypothetical protein
MLRGDGAGAFEDITVRAHLLDIMNVDYSSLDNRDSKFDAEARRIDAKFHENGKGVAYGDLRWRRLRRSDRLQQQRADHYPGRL